MFPSRLSLYADDVWLNMFQNEEHNIFLHHLKTLRNKNVPLFWSTEHGSFPFIVLLNVGPLYELTKIDNLHPSSFDGVDMPFRGLLELYNTIWIYCPRRGHLLCLWRIKFKSDFCVFPFESLTASVLAIQFSLQGNEMR